MAVNSDIVKGKWNQLKGEAKKQWGRLTDDEWDQIAKPTTSTTGSLSNRRSYKGSISPYREPYL
jgi:uncharacterized protein YjbJ (UPF0337 family)